jgi:hypothetical protein
METSPAKVQMAHIAGPSEPAAEFARGGAAAIADETIMPLSGTAQSELAAVFPDVPLLYLDRSYQGGDMRVNLLDETAELATRLHAELSEHCRVTGSWVTRQRIRIRVSYCGPTLSEQELIRMGRGVLRVMEPD